MNHRNSGHLYAFATFCLGLLLALPLHAEVSARLSASTTSLDQPVQLTLESHGEQDAHPDLSVLDEDFDILGRASQQSVSIINGSVSAKRALILTLLPKRQGKLTIPAIPFGDRQTAPLSLEVTAQPSDRGKPSQQAAWLEMSLDKDAAYPEEEVILTLKLYQSAAVRGEHLDPPQPSLSDTRVQLLDETNYTIERDGKPYRVLERSYGLYAYQTGKLEIAPVQFRGRSGGASIFSLLDEPFGRPLQSSRLVRAQSNPVSLQIKPIPGDFTGDHWLPARNIQLVATGLDDSAPLVAGKPVTRRIMLIADGLMSSQLPVISQRTPDGIKPYEERPQLRDTPRRTGISSSREDVVTLIPTQAGNFTLPAIEIPWWNTQSGKQEVARLPEVTLQVVPGATADSPAAAAQPTGNPVAAAKPEPREQTPTPPPPAGAEGDRIHWVVWALALAWLATLAGWWLSRRRQGRAETDPPPNAPPAADERLLDAAVEALIAAYDEHDAAAARTAWLQWGEQRWPGNPPHNLTRLARRCPAKVEEAVIALERALYSPAVETQWAGLFDAAALKEDTQQPPSSQPVAEQLLPLNP